MENWKWIPGYEGFYEISDCGNVRSHRVQILHPASYRGYKRVNLRERGKRGDVERLHSVHRLVLEAFLGPIPAGMAANHKNGIRDDNRLDNLEIVTGSENQIHRAHILGTGIVQGSKHGRHKLTEAQVLAIRAADTGVWGIRTKIAKRFGVSPQIVSFILNRRNWKHI